MKKLEYLPVLIVEKAKRLFHLKTWQIESFFVFVALATVAIVSNRGWIEWVGVFAVLFTWNHASVANRMEEMQAKQVREKNVAEVYCYKWTTRYFYMKEVLWFAYFTLIGAWSALVGVIVFLVYGWWRRTWRRYHPIGTSSRKESR